MTQIIINDILEQMRDENQMLLNDLELSQKRTEFLQNYRKVLTEFSANCVCNQNKPLINSIESLETQYIKLFKCENQIECKSEVNDIEGIAENDFPVETTRKLDEIDCESIGGKTGTNLTIKAKPLTTQIEKVLTNDKTSESMESTFESITHKNDLFVNRGEIRVCLSSAPSLCLTANIEKTNYLVFNHKKNTILRKCAENIDEINESLIESFVLKEIKATNRQTVHQMQENQKDPILPPNEIENKDNDFDDSEYEETVELFSDESEDNYLNTSEKAVNKSTELKNQKSVDKNVKDLVKGKSSVVSKFGVPFPSSPKPMLRKPISSRLAKVKELSSNPQSLTHIRKPILFSNSSPQTLFLPVVNGSQFTPLCSTPITTSLPTNIPFLTFPNLLNNLNLGQSSAVPQLILPITLPNTFNNMVLKQISSQKEATVPNPVLTVDPQPKNKLKCNICGNSFPTQNTLCGHICHMLPTMTSLTAPPVLLKSKPVSNGLKTDNSTKRIFNSKKSTKKSVANDIQNSKGVVFTAKIKKGQGLRHYFFDSFETMSDYEKTLYLKFGNTIDSFISNDNKMCLVFLRKNVSENGEEVSEVMYRCTECGRVNKSRASSFSHIKRHMNSTGTRNTISGVKRIVESGHSIVTPSQDGLMFSDIRTEFTNQENGRTELGPIQGYKCNYGNCGFLCTTRKTMNVHLTVHQTGKSSECDICHNWYINKGTLMTHKKLVHNIDNKPFLKCQSEGCPYQTHNPNNLKEHEKVHKPVVPLKCPKVGCKSILKHKSALETHIKYVHNKAILMRFPCKWPGCKRKFRYNKHLKEHMGDHTGANVPSSCDLCGRVFKSERRVAAHKIILHNIKKRPWIKCPHCPYMALQQNRIRSHSTVHKTRRPFKCDQIGCDKDFKSRQSLNIHKNITHCDERPFPCDWPGCDLTFKKQVHQRRHMNSVHMVPNVRFYCDYCDNNFKYKSDLNRHIRREHSIDSMVDK